MRKYLFLSHLFLLSIPFFVFSQETLTITTYYPSPVGVYQQLVTSTLGVGDNDASGGITSADAPNPAIANQQGDVWIAGDVGIGTTAPQARLDVAGGVRVGGVDGCAVTGCAASNAGTLRYCSNQMQYCNGTQWGAIGSFPAPVYDSGWQSVGSGHSHSNSATLNFPAGTTIDPERAVVDLTGRDFSDSYHHFGPTGIHQSAASEATGIFWYNLTPTSIDVYYDPCLYGGQADVEKYRVRIWTY